MIRGLEHSVSPPDSGPSPSPLPRGQGGGAENFNPPIGGLFLLAANPMLRGSESHLSNITTYAFSTLIIGKFQGF